RHGRAVRHGDRYHAGAGLPRRARGGARLLDGWCGAARAGAILPPRRASARRIGAEPLLGRPRRAAARVVSPGLRASADASRGAARVVLPERPGYGRERLGFFEPLAARPEGPAYAGNDRAAPGRSQLPPLLRRA